MNTYDYRKQKKDQQRIAEAMQQSNGGATFLQGGKPTNSVREITRGPGEKLAFPADENTPSAANVPDWSTDPISPLIRTKE